MYEFSIDWSVGLIYVLLGILIVWIGVMTAAFVFALVKGERLAAFICSLMLIIIVLIFVSVLTWMEQIKWTFT